MMRTHTCGELRISEKGNHVNLCGWVDKIRAVGKVNFIDLRDRYGKTQIVVLGKHELKLEYCVQVSGEVVERKDKNKDMETGDIEIFVKKVEDIKVLNECPSLPFNLDDENVDEDIRLKYRFLDLRTKKLQDKLILKHKLYNAIMNYMDKKGFVYLETPILAKSTPEGARDYIVPSRVNPGKFYALPQSPQIFKQLSMVAGFDRYFQIARCFRDEDLRADRQPEFTQLDIEMSFIEEEDIYPLMERMMKFVFKQVLGKDIKTPFPRLAYKDAMKIYNSDKPDLRSKTKEEFSFLWVTDFPMFEFSEEENRFVSMHHPFTCPHPEDIKFLHNDKAKVRSRAYDLVLNGYEIGGGSIRISDGALQQEVFKALGLSEKEAREKFGFLLDALQFAPPYGGLAFGLDRWAMLMAGKNSIREVIAFPKNKDAKDLMQDSPSPVAGDQLKQVHIKVV